MKLIYAMTLAIGLLATTAQAQQALPAAKEKKLPDPNKRICRPVVSTGSHLPDSICHTRAEWDSMAAASHEDAVETMSKLPPAR